MPGQAVRARLDPDGRQVVEVVVNGGYHPDLITAIAGRPMRLVFTRHDDDPCTERVVFSAPRTDRALSATGITIVDLPARGPGDVLFTCGMGRYRGHIEIVRDRSSTSLGRLQDRASRLGRPVVTALLFWVASLPLIALLGVLLLDPAAAIVAAGATLAVLIAGRLWLSGRSNAST
jgi:plastocyanin domain-containing protein